MESKILANVEYTRVLGTCRTAAERIIKETALTIRINGKHYTTAMILATLEREFVYGYLLTRGIIQSARDIRSLTIRNYIVDVTLTRNISKKTAHHKITSNLKVKIGDVFNCVKAISQSAIFTETEAVHSAGLFLNGRTAICIAEDLGRHNALDKVIGHGLLHNIDFRQAMAVSNGRQPSEMILKCRNVSIPIIATKAVPTTLAIEIAEKAGITIVGLVRGKTMIVYSHPERIV
jgi:FdhD protein